MVGALQHDGLASKHGGHMSKGPQPCAGMMEGTSRGGCNREQERQGPGSGAAAVESLYPLHQGGSATERRTCTRAGSFEIRATT